MICVLLSYSYHFRYVQRFEQARGGENGVGWGNRPVKPWPRTSDGFGLMARA